MKDTNPPINKKKERVSLILYFRGKMITYVCRPKFFFSKPILPAVLTGKRKDNIWVSLISPLERRSLACVII